MSLRNKNESMPIVITKPTFHMKNVTEKERIKCENFSWYSILCMTSNSSYHNPKLTSNPSGELLELVYWGLVPILVKHIAQIGYVVDVISLSYKLTKNVLHCDAQLKMNKTTLWINPIHRYCSAVERLGSVLWCAV
jgi:hypothetical protein